MKLKEILNKDDIKIGYTPHLFISDKGTKWTDRVDFNTIIDPIVNSYENNEISYDEAKDKLTELIPYLYDKRDAIGFAYAELNTVKFNKENNKKKN